MGKSVDGEGIAGAVIRMANLTRVGHTQLAAGLLKPGRC